MDRCLFCYQELPEIGVHENNQKAFFHVRCSKKFFGKVTPPDLLINEDEILKLAEQVVKSQRTVTGVQPKLSLGISKLKESEPPYKFTIVGLWDEYILKPQSNLYNSLPEIEDLTMHLAEISKIKTVSHSLITLKSGQYAYITKRIDRSGGQKLHMEDMCQLTERLTEHKYKGSHEQVAKIILKYSAKPGLDLINFYELVLFCFLTGNNDMHLKNFSLLKKDTSDYELCPAYDLVASELVVEGDDEELALNLNGKKKKLKRKDFEVAMKVGGLDDKVIQGIFKKFFNLTNKWHEFIDISFIPPALKAGYHELIKRKVHQLDE